jgi:hypothetical protein
LSKNPINFVLKQFFYTSRMDNAVALDSPVDLSALSYDDTVAYEEQVAPANDPEPMSLANRIGRAKVYLLAETSVARVGKVRR